MKAGVLVHPVRLAIASNPSDPRLCLMLKAMGKEKVMGRMDKGLAAIA